MNNIGKNQPTPSYLQTAPLAAPPPVADKAPKQGTDHISISVDARVKLGKDNKPEIVLDGMTVDGDVEAAVDKQMKGRKPGVRQQVTAQVMEAIAKQVAVSLEPVMEQKLGEALAQEHLPDTMAHDLAHQLMPKIAAVIAQQLAEKVKTTYSLGL